MTETGTERRDAAVTVVFEGSTSIEPCGRDAAETTTHELALAARAQTQGERGSALSRDLLSKVDLTPKATQPQDSWGWEIAGYLYLGGLGAGAFIVAVLLDWIGAGSPASLLDLAGGTSWSWAAIFVYWGPAITAFGASLLVFHLGRNWFLFFTACLNPRSSWLARGFIILTVFIVVGLATGIIAVFFPVWAGSSPAVWHAIQAVGLAFACGTALYTGILLRSMKYIPAWNAVLLPALFFVSALSTGAMGVTLGALLAGSIAGDASLAHSAIRAIEIADPAILIAEAVLLTLYVRHLAKGKPEARLSAGMLLSGTWRRAFWVGVVGAALALPLLLSSVSAILRLAGVTSFRLSGAEFEVASVLIVVAAVAVLCGGLLLRLGVLAIGIKERPPLYGMSMWRAEHALPLSGGEAGESAGG
jgi:formate-dependent nitrite reductase membrane component NrfD